MVKKTNKTRTRVVVDCSGARDRTKQSEMKACDVNGIIANFAKTGLLTPVTKDPGIYVDVSGMGDYKEALAQIDKANGMFEQLPSGVRKKFQHDPAAFLDYASDEGNRADMIEMGLIPRPKTKRAKARALRAEDKDVVVTELDEEGD